MASQEDQVATGTDKEPKDDSAEFSGAWDELEAEESGQSATAAERQDADGGKTDQGGDEAGQGGSAVTPGADAEQASREETSDDVWKDADPKLREAHENALKAADEKVARAENLARSNGGRLSQALSELNQLKGSLTSERSEEGATDQGQEAKDRGERLKQLREEYPEVAAPILDHMERLEATVEALKGAAVTRAEGDVTAGLVDNFAVLKEAHPDVESIVQDPAYAEWVKQQPAAVQRIVEENSKAVVNPQDAALVFDLFKSRAGASAGKSAAERRAEQLDAGRSASGKQPSPSSDARRDADFDSEWDRLDREDQRKAASRK